MSKMKFFSIKRKKDVYEGTFIAENAEIAKEIAIKNGFKVDDDTVFEDTTVKMTDSDKGTVIG